MDEIKSEHEKEYTVEDIFTKIFQWNKDKGLSEREYDIKQNAKYIISEPLEILNPDKKINDTHELFAESLVKVYISENVEKIDIKKSLDTIVDILDTNLDTIFYIFTFLSRLFNTLGITDPKEQSIHTIALMEIIYHSNLTKNGGVNSDNKYTKGDTFIPPEESIKKLLLPFFEKITKA